MRSWDRREGRRDCRSEREDEMDAFADRSCTREMVGGGGGVEGKGGRERWK